MRMGLKLRYQMVPRQPAKGSWATFMCNGKNGWTVTTVADTEDLTTSSVNQTNKTVTAVANKMKNL